MKLVCLLGSPRRNGNSATIAAHIVQRAQELGAETETVYLNGLAYRGCQGCYACKTTLERCVLNDDLAAVLESVREADALVLATPVYYGDVAGQLKNFIDRTFSYLVPDYYANPQPARLVPGKRLAFVFSQGSPDEARFADVFPRYSEFFRWYGFEEGLMVRGCGLSERSTVTKRTHLFEQADEVARKLVLGQGA
ncbi:flavodoxin family protein [Geobacter sp. FeAm09]|uniref:flavodoxin family protein n=1 Tax=Geobacter sp. FeAm09 TaxID=2597769 RepID=UPI0011EE92EA|nr:flavodoxin family protein [Geobacter sp. FeAm09]QEM67964.1 flavodoxin family protein [Geobacter sp. FeAm09]